MQSGPDIGSRIWSYVLEEEIGRGGMGVVYRGRHLALGREVAIKVLAPHLSEDPSFRERFLREAQLAASLDHPHIVPVFDAGEAEGWLFIAMKYVRGQDLSAAIRSEGRLDVNRTLLILGQVAGALDVAHRRGLVHRDVKPANVLLEPREEGEHAYLSDFGLTKPIQGATALTHTGQVLGTLQYAAPEQLRGDPVDGRTDVYALGCVLYECVAGRPPFVRDEPTQLVAAHLAEPAPRISERLVDMPAAMDSVIGTALAKDAGARFATCSQLITAAREALAGTRAVAAPVPPPVAPMAGPAPTGEVPADATIPAHRRSSRPPRRTSVLVAGVLGALLLLAAAAFAVVALTADGEETAAPTTSGPTGGPTGSSPTGSSPTISPTDSAAALREYVDRVDGLLAESNEVRLELIDAVTQAGESTAQAQFAVPVVQRVLDARRQELDTVNSWAVPPEASTANSFLSESFRHSLNDDVLYLEYVTLLAEGDRDGASGVLDVIADQNRATDAAKEAFLEEFNRVRIRVGLAPLPGDFKF